MNELTLNKKDIEDLNYFLNMVIEDCVQSDPQDMEDKFHSNKAIQEGTGIPIKDIANAKKRITLKMKTMMNKKRTSL